MLYRECGDASRRPQPPGLTKARSSHPARQRRDAPHPPRYAAGNDAEREGGMAGMLDGKVALVTGGGGGIGRATALAMVREGARVAVADFDAAAARDTVAQINAAGGQAITLTGDVTRTADVRAMVGDTIIAYGRLDCAFNNAGIAGYQVDAVGKKTAEWSEQSFDRMIAVNLKGVWLCMKEEIPRMQQQGGGAIVNTASIAGLIGLQTSSAYVAAKHGVIGLTKTAALEYADAKIRVNAVCPGFIETRMTESAMQRRGEQILSGIPAGRLGQPGEIAEMVVWLCSDRASYVTGAAYNVDGGWLAV
jgi:NAD(P)-dependent dehydrogenase (short-subunit alcohol dehydrogenase family)